MKLICSLIVVIILLIYAPHASAKIEANGPVLNGQPIDVELPQRFHLKNRGGSDGSGLCVFASLSHAGVWHNDPVSQGMFQFMFTRPGGGYPSKVDAMYQAAARQAGKPVPEYIQHTGGDMEFLKLAIKTGRYPSVTYAGYDGVYYAGRVAHMVNLVHLSDQWAAIHDNNYPGKWLWMSPSEFESRWKAMGGGWAVVLLKPGKPPEVSEKTEHLVSTQKWADNEDQEGLVIGAIPRRQNCADGSCDPSVAAQRPVVAADESTRWVAVEGNSGFYHLVKGNKVVGKWYPDGEGFWAIQEDGSWRSAPLPQALPYDLAAINTEYIQSYGTKYSKSGSPCSRYESFTSLVEGNLTDDGKAMRIVIATSDPAIREKFKKAWDGDARFAKYKGLFQLVADASDWQLEGYKPGITIVRPGPMPARSGEVIKQVGDLDLDLLLKLLDQILNPPPPAPTPDPNNPQPSPTPAPINTFYVLLGFILMWLFGKKSQKQAALAKESK